MKILSASREALSSCCGDRVATTLHRLLSHLSLSRAIQALACAVDPPPLPTPTSPTPPPTHTCVRVRAKQSSCACACASVRVATRHEGQSFAHALRDCIDTAVTASP